MSPVEHAPGLTGRLASICLDDVDPRATSWLWPGHIPAGALTLIDGDPGCGKSTIMASLTASITSGQPWPDGAPCTVADVLIFSAEEEVAETIRPKIDAAGGDARRVQIVGGIREQLAARPEDDVSRWFSLARDTAALEAKIREHGARAVFLDVLASYMGSTDTHRDADTRATSAR